MPQRHTEFFGADLARGPFAASNRGTAVLQLATALAQLRTPLARDDTALLDHAEFIRTLAERLAPAEATFIGVDTVLGDLGWTTTFRANVPTRTLLRIWLADSLGGGPTTAPPDTLTWVTGGVLQTLTPRAHYDIVTDGNGIATARIDTLSSPDYFWAVARGARVFYEGPVSFS